MLFIRYENEKQHITTDIIREFKSTNDKDKQYGHATQIIWAKTNKLGCAYSEKCGVRKHLVIHNYIFLLISFNVSRKILSAWSATTNQEEILLAPVACRELQCTMRENPAPNVGGKSVKMISALRRGTR